MNQGYLYLEVSQPARKGWLPVNFFLYFLRFEIFNNANKTALIEIFEHFYDEKKIIIKIKKIF